MENALSINESSRTQSTERNRESVMMHDGGSMVSQHMMMVIALSVCTQCIYECSFHFIWFHDGNWLCFKVIVHPIGSKWVDDTYEWRQNVHCVHSDGVVKKGEIEKLVVLSMMMMMLMRMTIMHMMRTKKPWYGVYCIDDGGFESVYIGRTEWL